MVKGIVRWWKFTNVLLGPWGKTTSLGIAIIAVAVAAFGGPAQQTSPSVPAQLLTLAPWYLWAIAALATALIFALVRSYLIVEERTLGLRVFTDRTSLHDGAGTLAKELADVERVWLLCPLATTLQAIDSDVLKKIDRAIFTNIADGIDFAPYATMLTLGSKIFRPTLYNITKRLMDAGKEVKWHRHPPLGAVIANPNSSKGWARLEVILPYVEAARRPSVTVYRADRPALYASIIDMFEKTWGNSVAPDMSGMGKLYPASPSVSPSVSPSPSASASASPSSSSGQDR